MPGVFNAYLIYRISQSQTTTNDLEPLRFTFPRLLSLTRQFEATDPRDGVFGLLGIPTTDADPANGELYITPDYTKSTDEVYLAVAHRSISSDLSLLAAVQHGPDIDPSLPSWVPRWNKVHTQRLAPSDSEPLLPPTETAPPTLPRPTTLTTPSRILATITSILPLPHPLDEHFAPIAHQLGHARLTQSNQISLAKTLTAGKTWYGIPIANNNDDPAAAAHLADFNAWLLDRGLNKLLAAHAPGPGADSRRFVQAMRNACQGRALFATAEMPHAVHLGPLAMRVGDVVAVFPGCASPFVVRPVADRGTAGGPREWDVRLVGECYVEDVGNAVARALLSSDSEVAASLI
jgi:hypothetical protein